MSEWLPTFFVQCRWKGSSRIASFSFQRLSAVAGNDFLRSRDFRRLPETIFCVPETSGGCRKRFSAFRRLPAVAGNDFLRSGDFRRLPETIFCVPETSGGCRKRFFLILPDYGVQTLTSSF
jgi:hypothetical protein